MANRLTQSFGGGDQIAQGSTINSWHVSQSVDAFTGKVAYDISVSGSVTITGSLSNGSNIGTVAAFAHAEGYNTSATADYAHAEGVNTTAGHQGSHAEGWATTTNEDYSHAEGDTTTTTGQASHAEGHQTQANGDYSHAEGQSTITVGEGSHAEGYHTNTIGFHSHAEGAYTLALGNESHAEGYYATASGFISHAEGSYTLASGSYSHAEGSASIAYGDYSHAEGLYTVAYGSPQTVVGQFNLHNNTTDLFVVGGGIDDGNRKDVFGVSITSVNVTASLNVSGSATITDGLTGSLYGTASWAENALTASYITSSNVDGPYGFDSVLSASYASGSTSSSYALSSSYAESSSYALSSSYAESSSYALSASYAPDTTFPYTGSALITGSLGVTGSLSVVSGLYSTLIVSPSTQQVLINNTNAFGSGNAGLFVKDNLTGDSYTGLSDFRIGNNVLTATLDGTGHYSVIKGLVNIEIDGSGAGNPLRLKVAGSNASVNTAEFYSPSSDPTLILTGTNKVGVNKLTPNYTLDVSGSGNFTNGLTVTGSTYLPSLTSTSQVNIVTVDTASGQLYYTASSAISSGGSYSPTLTTPGSYITVNSYTDFIYTAVNNVVNVSGRINVTMTPGFTDDIDSSLPFPISGSLILDLYDGSGTTISFSKQINNVRLSVTNPANGNSGPFDIKFTITYLK